MKRINAVLKLEEQGVVAVIRADSKEQGLKIVNAVKKGGIKMLEITMTVPGAIDIIKELAEYYKEEDVIIGAGTVLDAETARACILAGAQYIVSPYFNEEVVKLCNRYRILVMPGAMTVKEAIKGLEAGAEIIKVFPGSAFGPKIIKAFKGPIPQGNFMPTGGVNLKNVREWISAGAIAVGTGGDLTKGAGTGDYALVTETARKFVKAVREAKERK
ncbi:bifunctional 4-hydroxy-2-oxoglutarate aldolase/2-dehydro-3-deoxy-phosphogluconate aldolase [Clostridium luticellarii]|jgi:2-dehydro-3-deoxyphosphogluconate aldolase/(4S)-4-hydroxy-2-oxoglutarate aldolase|uniref:KHG/KDPG aldolase n=1 Tax=Clostridium luticellarii TaxID=1691940 RepID=A0A2T0BMH3_9CLOT|nr:bifunctional 4-hydroxy-2-oxoglutarate aldolase/2-dehydro-3-deoxy-phosphogluconate aldolase [Clostridium luticellarii]MCI1944987.1 bifunctional 4-hydroxy-2-oxoglutarate aldolase/2-dehydro-3-deoxy-phosphogluconate aldolase [Clostridium luticellarii]MCI1967863.1 bifunctional 4-hydroxy-2-oxoglutarate aldolase/2-dehydro-3-deoxy-phosphogluconate aldolase [Clostridium luticellarii]MCI1995767.1 bifunctional 4-hydroxy-2-oxoglutarate aldolase/2-dehydro-3-deoxy-phosphogluconate aldolase [Clostridium lut